MTSTLRRLELLEQRMNGGIPEYLVTFMDGKVEQLDMLQLYVIATDIQIGHCFDNPDEPLRPYRDAVLISGSIDYYKKMSEIIEHEKGRTKPAPLIAARDDENKRYILKYPAGKEFDTDPDWIPL